MAVSRHINRLRCHPRPHPTGDRGQCGREGPSSPNAHHHPSSRLKTEGEHFKEQAGKQSSSPKNSELLRDDSHVLPQETHPHVGHGRLSETVFIDSIPTISPVMHAHRLPGQEGGEARNSHHGKQDFHPVGLWDCEFLRPLPVQSHHLVFKTRCLPTALG